MDLMWLIGKESSLEKLIYAIWAREAMWPSIPQHLTHGCFPSAFGRDSVDAPPFEERQS